MDNIKIFEVLINNAAFECFFCVKDYSKIFVFQIEIKLWKNDGSIFILSNNTIFTAVSFIIIDSQFTKKKKDAFNSAVLRLSFNSTIENAFFGNLSLFQTSLIAFEQLSTKFYLKNSTFSNLSQKEYYEIPLILNVNNTSLNSEIINCQFNYNIAYSMLIYILNNFGIFRFENSTFSHNYAKKFGFNVFSHNIQKPKQRFFPINHKKTRREYGFMLKYNKFLHKIFLQLFDFRIYEFH